MLLITNNPDVRDAFKDKHGIELRFIEGSYRDVLVAARDLIHSGSKLLTHPLMGSLKPNETPYRSVALAVSEGQMDMDSLLLIENSIQTFDKFAAVVRPDRGINTPERMLADFRLIDLSLISSALDH